MNAINTIKYIAATCVIMTMASCEKELDFEYHDIAPLPVIEASISETETEVKITYTTPMNEQMDDMKVTDAIVRVMDLSNGASEMLTADQDGIYRSSTGGIEEHEYEIEVTLNGETYRSRSRMMEPTMITDLNFYWVKMPGDDMAALQIRFADNELTEDYYWIRTYRNGEHYQWSVIPDISVRDGILEEVLTTTHRDPAQEEDEKSLLVDGDEMTVTVTPVSKNMAYYLMALMNGENGMKMYEGGECLGYFLASPVASKTIVYHPDDIQYAD